MNATPETTTTDTQHHFLTGLAQQGRYAHEFARAGRTEEALEHCAAIEGLVAAYREAIGGDPKDPSLQRVLDDVIAERKRQDEKWGVQNMHDFEHISILTEEVGEAAKAANEANFTSGSTRGDFTHLRKELIQVAAVAVDHAQAIDRRTARADGDNE